MSIEQPYLLFLGDAPDELAAKTAFGVFEWRPNACVGQFRLPGCKPKLSVPELSLSQAVDLGAKTLLIGVANRGGVIPETWQGHLVEALRSGLDVASGLHTRLSDISVLRGTAERLGRRLHDVRHPVGPFQVGNGNKRQGQRLLTVGTDCSVGKMYATLALEQAMRERGMDVDFRATGQTGILIQGNGISVDAVVADFISGAIEQLCPENDPQHWDLIEGQGSLFHPSFAGVSLGLLHGAQPDVLVLCHEPTRTHMRGLPHRALPSLEECVDANLGATQLVNPDVRFAGVAVNTKALDAAQGHKVVADTEQRLGLPCADPMRGGVDRIVDNLR